jgi:hypothetical protein
MDQNYAVFIKIFFDFAGGGSGFLLWLHFTFVLFQPC